MEDSSSDHSAAGIPRLSMPDSQRGELPAVLPAGEQVDIAARPYRGRRPRTRRPPLARTARLPPGQSALSARAGVPCRRLHGRGDADDLCQYRESLLPRPAELGRKPQQRPQPPQDPLIQVRVQVLGAGRLDQDCTVKVNNPARRIEVVDRVPRPVQVRRQVNSARRRQEAALPGRSSRQPPSRPQSTCGPPGCGTRGSAATPPPGSCPGVHPAARWRSRRAAASGTVRRHAGCLRRPSAPGLRRPGTRGPHARCRSGRRGTVPHAAYRTCASAST